MAALALVIWPFCALVVFRALPFYKALIWAVLVPYLFLPEVYAIGLPGVPDIDKTSSIAIGLVLGMMITPRDPLQGQNRPMQAHKWIEILTTGCLIVIIFGAGLTVLNNGEPLYFGPRSLPAMRPWDVISLIGQLVLMLLPFWLARKHLASAEAHKALLMILALGGLFYTVPMLVEMRFSPQLHRMIYGFHQHSFVQHVRDGFRPMVFMEHGLWVGFFMFSATLSAFALWRSEGNQKWLWAGLWLFAILLASRNLGAAAICIVMLGLLLMTPRRIQMFAAMGIAICVLVYPAMRQFQIVPLDSIVSAAASISEDRADSFSFRLEHENMLLERASLKPLTGWGSWDRDQIFNQRGQDISVSEGRWIQTIGRWGWLGYVGLFGLLTLPVILLGGLQASRKIGVETACLVLICTGNLVYMIPNATLTPLGLLAFGALAGYVEKGYRAAIAAENDAPAPKDHKVRYTRFS